jgi:hypothetical protein
MKRRLDDLTLLGGPPGFGHPLHVAFGSPARVVAPASAAGFRLAALG